MGAESERLRWGMFRLCLAAGLAMTLSLPSGKAADSQDRDSAKQLVADALRAEVDGNLAKRRVLLSVAIDAEPDFARAVAERANQHRR